MVISISTAAVPAMLLAGALAAGPAAGAAFLFSTGDPDGRIATGARPSTTGKIEIESADDFILGQTTSINHATFTGLLPAGVSLSDIGNVRLEIYRVFPKDSQNPPSGNVPTRVNSPSDVAFQEREVASSNLSFVASILNGSFSAANSVLNGINKIPNQTTGGEGPVTGQEVLFDVSLLTPFFLPADHYFFIPQVELSSGDFLWLSAAKPITGGTGAFDPDLQSWIRNEDLAPDWLRIGTDIVGAAAGGAAPTFNAAFSLQGETVPEPAPLGLLLGGLALLGLARRGWPS